MIHIGSVPYLNGKPLIYQLDQIDEIDVIQEVPSRLAIMLKNKEIAVGLVSLAACFQNPELEIIPRIVISCNGPAKSVKLFYNNNIEDIKSVALDSSSISSVTLIRVILSEVYGLQPEYTVMPPVLPAMLHACDGAVLIGDPAMRIPSGRYKELDLGSAWYDLTGLPFVFAVWASNPEMIDPTLIDILSSVKISGLAAIDQISHTESERLDLPYDVCFRYLQEIMGYDMTDAHIEAMSMFRKKVIQHQIMDKPADLKIYGG
ncbi:MAG: menaquinone biosynthetic enzyme MqnA/MqnD family protein [Armatimonadota bacterium]